MASAAAYRTVEAHTVLAVEGASAAAANGAEAACMAAACMAESVAAVAEEEISCSAVGPWVGNGGDEGRHAA